MTHLRIAACFAVVAGSVACAGGRGAAIETAIAEIEAGRATTPLVAQPSPGSDAEVTFLVKSSDGPAPRIVSDVTGWGESPDDSSFDLTIGRMTRIGSSDWYRRDAQVAPRSRIEYLVVYGEIEPIVGLFLESYAEGDDDNHIEFPKATIRRPGAITCATCS